MSSAEQLTTYTVGILYPGHSAEDDFPKAEVIFGDLVQFPVAHTPLLSDAHTTEAMHAAGKPEALQEGVIELWDRNVAFDSLVWACTSGSFTWGLEGAQWQAKLLHGVSGKPASSTSLAFLAALKYMGARRVSVAATYPPDLASDFLRFLDEGDVEVVKFGSDHVETASDAGRKNPEEVADFVAAYDSPDADAILVPDTALHTIGYNGILESRVGGKPVLTANQVSIWEGLRLISGTPPLQGGMGSLFSQ